MTLVLSILAGLSIASIPCQCFRIVLLIALSRKNDHDLKGKEYEYKS